MHDSPLPPKPASLPGRNSVWLHRSGRLYRVLAVSRHSECVERWLVTYEPLTGGDAWTRALLDPGGTWPGFLDILDQEGEPHRFMLVSGPRTWRDEPPDDRGAAERLADAAPLMRAALKAYRDQYGDRPSWPDDEVACLDLAEAAIAAASPPPEPPRQIKITWRDENYGSVSGMVAFRCYDARAWGADAYAALAGAFRNEGFMLHPARASWMADSVRPRKAALTAALQALGYQVVHGGCQPDA